MALPDIGGIGGWKFIGDRALNYLGRVISLISFALVLNINSILGVDVWTYAPYAIGFIVFGILFMIFDTLVILPQENRFCFRQNPVIQDMHDDIKLIKEKMGLK